MIRITVVRLVKVLPLLTENITWRPDLAYLCKNIYIIMDAVEVLAPRGFLKHFRQRARLQVKEERTELLLKVLKCIKVCPM